MQVLEGPLALQMARTVREMATRSPGSRANFFLCQKAFPMLPTVPDTIPKCTEQEPCEEMAGELPSREGACKDLPVSQGADLGWVEHKSSYL